MGHESSEDAEKSVERSGTEGGAGAETQAAANLVENTPLNLRVCS